MLSTSKDDRLLSDPTADLSSVLYFCFLATPRLKALAAGSRGVLVRLVPHSGKKAVLLRSATLYQISPSEAHFLLSAAACAQRQRINKHDAPIGELYARNPGNHARLIPGRQPKKTKTSG